MRAECFVLSLVDISLQLIWINKECDCWVYSLTFNNDSVYCLEKFLEISHVDEPV